MSEKVALYSDQLTSNFLQYAIKVISDRAIPSVQDGFKPVQRKILFGMFEDRLLSTSPFRKCARVVGSVLGKYHPHSDGSIYGALVNMTDEYIMTPFVGTQGNFGTRGEDPAAAMRYTECRLHKNAQELLFADLDEDCVEYIPNFDQSTREPALLPTKVPVLLLNGALGIAVSLATSIPSHNLQEVIDMCICMINDDPVGAYAAFKGPDWKEGGRMFMSEETRKSIFESGTGQVQLYGTMDLDIQAKGRSAIRIWNLPWKTNRQKVIEQILTFKKEFPDIFITRSSNPGQPIITIRTKQDPERVARLIRLKTGFVTSYSYNTIFIDGKQPIQGGIRDIIEYWLTFRKKTLHNRFTIKKDKTAAELRFWAARNLLATEHMDAFLDILRKTGREAAIEYLKAYVCDDTVVIERLMSLRLHALAKESSEEIRVKLEDLNKNFAWYTELTTSPESLKQYIINELLEIRRTAPERSVELLEEPETASFRSSEVLTRKLAVSASNKIVLGSGERLLGKDAVIVFTKRNAYRLRVSELKNFRDGAEVNPAAIRKTEDQTVKIALSEKYALLVCESGRSLWFNLDRIRQSASLRQFGLSESENFRIWLFTEEDLKSFVILHDGHGILPISVGSFEKGTARTISKFNLKKNVLKDALVVPAEQRIIVDFNIGFSKAIKLPEATTRSSRRFKVLSKEKKIKKITLESPVEVHKKPVEAEAESFFDDVFKETPLETDENAPILLEEDTLNEDDYTQEPPASDE